MNCKEAETFSYPDETISLQVHKRHGFDTRVTILYWALWHLVSHCRVVRVLEIQFSVIKSP
jgi:hypothetical protein